MVALKEAKRRLGSHGIYVLGDITNLPLIDDAVDGVVSLHTIYHVAEDQQKTAFHEIYRVLKRGSLGVVVYSWGSHSLLMKISQLPSKISLMLRRKLGEKSIHAAESKQASKLSEPKLYFHPKSYKWFMSQEWKFDFDILVWKSLDVPFLQRYIHSKLLGKQILSLIYWLEDRFPYPCMKYGQYPMFIIKK